MKCEQEMLGELNASRSFLVKVLSAQRNLISKCLNANFLHFFTSQFHENHCSIADSILQEMTVYLTVRVAGSRSKVLRKSSDLLVAGLLARYDKCTGWCRYAARKTNDVAKVYNVDPCCRPKMAKTYHPCQNEL